MPIYEYRCSNCHRKVSIFWRTISAVDESKARCTFCGSAQLNRLASRVRVIRGGASESSDVGGGGGPDGGDMDDRMMSEMAGLDENDPRSLGRFMRKMAAESGEELGPEFNEIVGRLEKGEDPEKIEQSMGDVLGDPGEGMGGMGGMGGMDDDMPYGPPAPEPASAEETAEKAKDAQAPKTTRRPVRAKTRSASGGKAKPKRKTKK